MSGLSADQTAELRALAASGALKGLADVELDVPEPDKLLFGALSESTLDVYTQDMSTHWTAVLDKVSFEAGGKTKFADVGMAVPRGVYYFPVRAVDGASFPLVYFDRANAATRFLFVPGEISFKSNPDVRPQLIGRGMLFINVTARPEPLFGFLSYEPDRWMTFRWQFIDLCVSFALNLLLSSEAELKKLKVEAALGAQSPMFVKMAKELRGKANIYAALEALRDALHLLTYLRWLHFLPGFQLQHQLQLDAVMEDRFTRLVTTEIPAIEAKLEDNGKRVTLDDLVKKIDEKLVELRKAAPLLGRLSWLQIKLLDDNALGRAVVALADDLLAQNAEAQARSRKDQGGIRKLFALVPPRIMGIPRITQTVHKQHEAEINADVDYFSAVRHLEDEAATFGLMLGLAQLVFTFFCPPIGVALGFMQAAVSIRDAEYKTLLSNADVNIDEAIVTQAEAREARFWAAVDAIFACVDLNEFTKAVQAAREVEQAAKLERLAEEATELRKLGEAAKQDLADVERLAEGVKPPLPDAKPVDVSAARQELADARKGTVDVDPANPARLDEPPKTAEEALAQAQKKDGAAWQELTGQAQGTRKGERTAENARVKIEKEYKAHFDDAVKQRAEAQAKGLPLPPGPEDPTKFMHRRREAFLESRTAREAEDFGRKVRPPARDTFWQATAKQSKKTVGQLLETGNHALLRDTLIKRVKKLKLRGLTGFDKQFLEDFQKAVARGAKTSELDAMLAKGFLEPLDALAAKAGYAAGQGREFALFGKGVAPLEQWASPDAVQSLRRLFEDARVDNDMLRAALNNPAHAGALQGALMTEELAKALDKIRDVPGVLTLVSLDNPTLLRRLATGGSAFVAPGNALEAIMTARLIEPAAAAGAKVSVGRRWWLETIQDLKAEGVKGIGNTLEADILVELADGRRFLIDTKFYPAGLNVEERIVSQLEKFSSGINEGLIHGGEFWMSDSIGELRDAFSFHAEWTGKGKIRLEENVLTKGFPQDFFDMESRVAVVDRNGAILILDEEKASEALISRVANKAADRILAPLVPEPFSLGYRVPMVTQAATVVARSQFAGDGSGRARFPMNPLGTAARVVVQAAPAHTGADTPIDVFELLRAQQGTALAGRLVSGEPSQVTEAELAPLKKAGKLCRVDARSGAMLAPVSCIGRSIPLRDPSGAQNMLFVHRRPDRGTDRVYVQAVLLDDWGQTLRVYPPSPTDVELKPGVAVVIPFSPQASDGAAAFPFPEGAYRWSLRVTSADGHTQVHPGVLPMLVEPL